MERLFESTIRVKIHNNHYDFSFPDLSEVHGRTLFVNSIKKEISKYFFKGYQDNKSGKNPQTNFTSDIITKDLFMKRRLSDILKEIYQSGYSKFDHDENKEYKIDLNLNDPRLESNVKLLINQTFSDGLTDAKISSYKKTKINVPDNLSFIEDELQPILIKSYNDGYEEGIDFINQKYKFNIPKINNLYMKEKIEKEVQSAFSIGQDDFDNRKNRNENYETNLNFIKDSFLRNQIYEIIKKAYIDGYEYNNKIIEKKLDEKRKEDKIRDEEEKEIFYLMKKYGKPLENKFRSVLYQYIIKNNELKVDDDYKFINIKSDDIDLLNQIKKIVNQVYTKGKEDATNGLKKQFVIFSMPFKIKDELTKNEISNLVNKAYNDGYKKIIDEISQNISFQVNKNDEIKRLEELLKKFKKYKPIKKISNLPDRFVNQNIYSMYIPNEY